MKRIALLILLLTLAVLLLSCGTSPGETEGTEPAASAYTDATETLPPETVPNTTAVPPETEVAAAAPEHSSLYLEDLSVEDVIRYFNEVCLDAEIVHGGDPSRLQKWTEPIRYSLNGEFTQQDISVLNGFTAWLNAIEGFPGISEAEEHQEANLQIYFCSREELVERMGAQFRGMDAAVTFWYEMDEIYSAIICYRTDLGQYLRNSVILEEIYNGLGPVQDTQLREDSIIFSGYSEPQSLTAVDELILKLLYHPLMQCGMDLAECEEVIRQLYY